MKKKHIQYKSGLLIGLLSLSILSSCAHTRQELGMGNAFSRQEEQNDHMGSPQESNRSGLVRAAFRSTVELLAEVTVEDLLWICAASYGLSYAVGYARNYTPGYTEGLLHAYLGSGISE